VAVKELLLPGGLSPELRDEAAQRAMREARAAALVQHRSIVTVHDVVLEEGRPCIVMDLLPGRSLDAVIAAEGPLPPDRVVRIGLEVLGALRAAHAHGVLHRDVKPANIFLRDDGRAVLTDFGIAALHDSPGLTANGDVVGSPEYIAPERLRGQEGNPASDLWSLGMLLYVAVEGRHPMRRDTPIATLAAVLNGRIPPPVQAGPMAGVLRALLTPDPAARPAAAQLDHMLAQAADSTADTHLARRPSRRSRPLRAALIAGTAVLAVVVAAAVIVLPRLQDGTAVPKVSFPTGIIGTPEMPTPLVTGVATDQATPPPAGKLLTPSRIKTVIAAMEEAAGGTEFTKFVVYDEYAIAEAPVRGKKNVYDTYTYRGGQVTRATGSTLEPGQARVKLSAFAWDTLPALERTAEKRLGIAEPTSRYLVVEPGWVFADGKPVLLVYLSDAYGGAYLAADVTGKVLTVMPRD
jgi:hypothetical protein